MQAFNFRAFHECPSVHENSHKTNDCIRRENARNDTCKLNDHELQTHSTIHENKSGNKMLVYYFENAQKNYYIEDRMPDVTLANQMTMNVNRTQRAYIKGREN